MAELAELIDLGNVGRGGVLALAVYVLRTLLARGDHAAAEHLAEIRDQRDHLRDRNEELEHQLQRYRDRYGPLEPQ